MFDSHFKIANNQLIEGISIKVLHHEESMIMTQLILARGACLPAHIHPNDHSAYLLKGKIRIIADGISSIFCAGDSWCLRKGIAYRTEALEDSVVLEVFNPQGETEGFEARRRMENNYPD